MSIEIIAEIAQAHDGSLGRAYTFIDIAKECGADAVKFQTHIAEFESSIDEPWRIKFSPQDELRYDYWKRMEFTEEQWKGLFQHAKSLGLEFIGTPFSTESYEMLKRIGVTRWKISSGEIGNRFLMEKFAEDKPEVYMSTGMSDWDEIDRAVDYLTGNGVKLKLYQCTTRYPVPPEKVGLNVIAEMKARYNLPVGLSDHSGEIYAPLAAAALGAEMIEVHLCMNKKDFGPDVSSSLDCDGLKELVTGIRQIETMRNNPIDKDKESVELEGTKRIFSKSLYLRRDMKEGEIIQKSDLIAKKPCNGIGFDKLDLVLGKCVLRDLKEGHLLDMSDLK